MRTFCVTVVAGILFVMAFNVATDPWHRWWTEKIELKNPWPRELVLQTPGNFNERVLKVEHAKIAEAPDVLVIGNSYGDLIDSKMFAPSVKFHNGWLSSASLVEYVSIWQTFKNRGITPKRLIIVAGQKMLNQNENQSNWTSQFGLYQEFIGLSLKTHPGLTRYWLKLFAQRVYNVIYELTSQMNWQMVVDSASAWVNGTARQPRVFAYVPEKDLPYDASARRSDGSLIYPQKVLDATDRVDEERLRQFTEQATSYRTDPDTRKVFEALLDGAEHGGTQTLIVVMPYPRRIRKDPVVAGVLGQFTAALVDITKNRGALTLCDRNDPELSRCSEEEFVDPSHAARSCTQKVIASCLAAAHWEAVAPARR